MLPPGVSVGQFQQIVLKQRHKVTPVDRGPGPGQQPDRAGSDGLKRYLGWSEQLLRVSFSQLAAADCR